MVAQLSAVLPTLSMSELAELPRLASRGQILDEDFFHLVAQRISEVRTLDMDGQEWLRERESSVPNCK